MGRIRQALLDAGAHVLTKPRGHYQRIQPNNLGKLRRLIRKGDVLLVDGDQRISEVIKYLTQSSWSHAALYVGDELLRRHPAQRAALTARFGVDAEHLVVEALMESGVVASPLMAHMRTLVKSACSSFARSNTRRRKLGTPHSTVARCTATMCNA